MDDYKAIRRRVVRYFTDDDPRHQATYQHLKRALIFSDGLSSPRMDPIGIKGSRVENAQEKRMITLAEYRQANNIVQRCLDSLDKEGREILIGYSQYDTIDTIKARLFCTSTSQFYRALDKACFHFADMADIAAQACQISPKILPPLMVVSDQETAATS